MQNPDLFEYCERPIKCSKSLFPLGILILLRNNIFISHFKKYSCQCMAKPIQHCKVKKKKFLKKYYFPKFDKGNSCNPDSQQPISNTIFFFLICFSN